MSVNRTKSALRSFFAFCTESGWVRANPARLIRSSSATPKELAVLTDEEVGRLRDQLNQRFGRTADRDRLVFELLLGTGIRSGSQEKGQLIHSIVQRVVCRPDSQVLFELRTDKT